MRDDRIALQITWSQLKKAVFIGLAAVLVLVVTFPIYGQKEQEKYSTKFDITEKGGAVVIATSADGRYIYVAGRNGVIVSDDYGKTGSWSQTVRMK
jgi:hypothetical protein